MSAFFELLETYGRFCPYGVAFVAGIVLAIVDRNSFRRHILLWLPVVAVIAGAVGMKASPFTFQGDDHYFQSLVAMLFALAALLGYALATVAMWAWSQSGGRTS